MSFNLIEDKEIRRIRGICACKKRTGEHSGNVIRKIRDDLGAKTELRTQEQYDQ